MKTLLAGEGPTEIGDWASHPSYRSDPPKVGVLERLVGHFMSDAEIIDGLQWKDIKKYRAGDHRAAETRTVMGLALHAAERGCALVVFSRDRDGVFERRLEIDAGVAAAMVVFPALKIVGGLAVETIESWLLSLLGTAKAEALTDPKAVLMKQKGPLSVAERCGLLDAIDLDAPIRADAHSLREWVAALRAVSR